MQILSIIILIIKKYLLIVIFINFRMMRVIICNIIQKMDFFMVSVQIAILHLEFLFN